jgi:phage-related protein
LAEQAYAYVTLIPQAKGFQQGIAKELDGIGGVGGSTGKQAGEGFSKGFGGAIKGLIGPIAATLSTVAIGSFVKDAVGAASAFSAEFEGVNQIFGSAAASVQAFADQAAYSVGITETAALQAAKGFGVFAGAAGLVGQDAASFSTSLVQAAGDLASFNDVPVEETLAAIKSGLQGQGEPLSKFGILMNDATLRQEAFKQGIIETTDQALTPQEKVLAANALILGGLGVAQGDFVNYQDTFGNALKTTTALFDEMKTELGAALIPALEELLPTLQPIIEQATPMLISLFEALVPIIQTLAENMGPLFEAFAPLIEGFEMLLAVGSEILAAVLPILIEVFATLAPIVVSVVEALLPLITLALPALIELINTVLPILTEWWSFLASALVPVIDVLAKIIGVTLAVAFKAITTVIKEVTRFFKPFFDTLKPGIIDLVTTAVKNLTTFLAPLFAALKPIVDALLQFAGIDPASLNKKLTVTTEIKGIGSGVNTNSLAGILAASGVPPVITPKTPIVPKPAGTVDDSAKKAREAAIKERAALKKVIADTREAFFEARNDYQDDITAINEKFEEQREKIGKAYDKDVMAANKQFAKATAQITERYNEAVASATESRDKSLNQALKEHNKQIANIQADFAKRQADLITQSMDRLRNAYRSAVAINVASIFDSERIAGSVDGLVETLRDKLTASRRLIENAARLSALGFSQTFIEQVVGSGTDVGNELAESIIGASPETVSELKSLYGSLEKESESGMDALSQKIYDQTGLATTELKNLYSAAQVELTAAIAQQNATYQETVAGINAEFNNSIVEAQKQRDKALVEAQAALDESLLEAKEKRDDALAEAQKDFQDALIAAAESYEKDLMRIEKSFNEKVASMSGAAKGLANEIRGLNSALTTAQTDLRKPVFPGFSTGGGPGGLIPFAEGGFVNSPTAALIGEAGPEVVIPLDRFESMMGMRQGGPAVNYYAAPNQSLDSEQELFMAMKRAKVVAAW